MQSEVSLEQFKEPYQLGEKQWTLGRNLLVVIGLLAWAGCAYGWATDAYNFHASYLVNYLFFLTIGWGATFFVAVQHVTSAAWSVTVRRFMENLMITVPPMAILFIPVFAGIPVLYEWGAGGYFDPADPAVQFKAVFFSQPFYMVRSVIYFAAWILLTLNLYRHSVAQDGDGNLPAAEKAKWWAGPGLLVLIVTVTMASVDWVMSLDPHWYSTMFGIYVFSGGGLAFMALLTLVSLAFRRFGMLKKSITVEHYHDLGKWMFALTVWWAYIAFSQYMLIWYADIPEETVFFHHRLEGSWVNLSLLLLVGHFLIPFFVLLSRKAKRTLPVLGIAAVWILVMHGMDLHWLILPSVHEDAFHIQWHDLATFLATGSVFALTFWYRLRSHPMIPTGDLRLREALLHHNT